MRRILLRSRKGPLEVASPEATLAGNLIGNNSGNLVFSHAAHKLLETADTEVVSNGFRADPRDAGRINAEHDVFVVPLANAFRRSFEPSLHALTALIERLRIPVVVLGVGAQGTLDYDASRLAPMEGMVKRFVRAVLDRSPSVGVRGEFTLEYLQGLGFRDVEVIGCPSMFLHGPELQVTKRAATLHREARLTINISPYVTRLGPTVMRHCRSYPNLTYIAQDLATLDQLLWGEPSTTASQRSRMPVHVSHPLYQENKIRFFVDPWPWLSYLAENDFSFGTRIHGNITSLVAGTPAYVLAHDSRTLELARYFEIPHLKLGKRVPDIDAARLYDEADFSHLNKGQAARFDTLAAFLTKHGLDHVYAAGGDRGASFDARQQATRFPPPVEALPAAGANAVADRVRWLRERESELANRVAELEATVGRGRRRRRWPGAFRRLARGYSRLRQRLAEPGSPGGRR